MIDPETPLGRVPDSKRAEYDAAVAELTESLPTFTEPPPRPTDSNLAKHAWDELVRVGAFTADTDFYGGMTGRAVMDLVDVFVEQGHSGMSGSLVADAFHRLVMFKPLGPLTDDPDEWQEVADGLWQSRRQSGAFSSDGGETYRLNSDRDTIHTSEPAKNDDKETKHG